MFNKEELDNLDEKAELLGDIDQGEKFSYTFADGFTIRCPSTKAALKSLVKKLRKGKRHKPVVIKPRSCGKRYNAVTFEDFVQDGEFDNAVQYNRQFNRETLFHCIDKPVPLIKVSAVPGDDRFVAARTIRKGVLTLWNIYHKDSGMCCSFGSANKAGALLKLEAMTKQQRDEAISLVNCTKQAMVLSSYD